ncbi:hypothetical protein [Chromohalobacter japonicus]|nr:hypothetical protein [Chromohalobacter japonicus]
MLILGAQLTHFLDGQTSNLRNHLIFQLGASDPADLQPLEDVIIGGVE